jgi:hypothetical protein
VGEQIKKTNFKRFYWVVALFLVSLVFILDTRYFSSPPLRSDDWSQFVRPIVFDRIPLLDITGRRPLLTSFLALISPVFGLQIQWYYIFNWLLLFLSAVVVYQIIRRAFPRYLWLALPVAMIFLVYPVNYARTWLTVINNTFALLLALVSILLLLLYRWSGKTFQLVLANLLFLISLGTYEAAFGLVMFVALVLIFYPVETAKKRRWAFLSIIFVGALFLLWRTVLQSQWVDLQDQYISNLELSFGPLISRYGQGLFIFLFNWVGTLLLGFGDQKYWVFLGISLTVLAILLAFVPRSLKTAKRNSDYPFENRVQREKQLLVISLIGLLAWAAGYIPVIMLWAPAFYGDSSRVNLSSIPGGALALTAAIALIITFFAKRKERVGQALMIAVVPLVLLGIANQVHAQNQRVAVWEENKSLWQAMFTEVPNLENGTKVVIVIPGYEKLGPFEMLPFRGDWEAEAAIDTLYNNQDLFAEYYYVDSPALQDNWVPVDGDYSRYVFVFFDPTNDSVRVIRDPVTALNLSIQIENYDPADRIIGAADDTAEYRSLVD